MDFTDIQPLFLANYGYKPRCKLYNVRGRRYHLYPYAIQSLASKFPRLPWRIRHAVALHYWFFKFLRSPCTVTARYWEWLLTVWKAPSEDCFFPQPMLNMTRPARRGFMCLQVCDPCSCPAWLLTRGAVRWPCPSWQCLLYTGRPYMSTGRPY